MPALTQTVCRSGLGALQHILFIYQRSNTKSNCSSTITITRQLEKLKLKCFSRTCCLPKLEEISRWESASSEKIRT